MLKSLIEALKQWAEETDSIRCILLAGSWARGTQKPDSDIDLCILTEEKEKFLEEKTFPGYFGTVLQMQREEYGACTSLRVWYENGMEVEFGLMKLSWAALPLDAGTRRVLEDGYQVIADKDGVIERVKPCLKTSEEV